MQSPAPIYSVSIESSKPNPLASAFNGVNNKELKRTMVIKEIFFIIFIFFASELSPTVKQ